jgi:hypothetical protein
LSRHLCSNKLYHPEVITTSTHICDSKHLNNQISNQSQESKCLYSTEDEDLFSVSLISSDNLCLNIMSECNNSTQDVTQNVIETDLGSNNKSIIHPSSMKSTSIEYNVVYKPQEVEDSWENRIPSYIPSSIVEEKIQKCTKETVSNGPEISKVLICSVPDSNNEPISDVSQDDKSSNLEDVFCSSSTVSVLFFIIILNYI